MQYRPCEEKCTFLTQSLLFSSLKLHHLKFILAVRFRFNFSAPNGSQTVADPGFPVGGRRPVGGGANLQRVHFSAKTYVKMKEIDPVWGARTAEPP